MSHEDASKLTLEERRRRAIAIFNQLNKPGTITRALVDLHRAGGPSDLSTAEIRARYPALADVTARMRRIGKALSEPEGK